MKIKILPFLLIIFSTHLFAVEINSDNLKNILESKNARVVSAKLQAEAAEERKGYLARSFLPSLELYGAQESFKTGSQNEKNQPQYGAEAKINLFNGGRDKIQSEIRSLKADQIKFHSMRIQSEELEKARSHYWQIIYSKEKIELIKSVIAVNSQNIKSAERRINSGIATESDRIEFEMKAVELKQELDEVSLNFKIQINNLAVLLGFDDPDDLTFPENISHEHNFESALAHSLKDHQFLYKENELQSQAQSLEAKSQQRSWWPKLDAFASYNQFNERGKDQPIESDRRESVLGVRVSMSLANTFESTQEAKSLNKESLASQKLAELHKKEVEIHIHNEMSELELLHNQVHTAEENIIRAEKYYKLTLSEYSRGVKNSPDVLGASEKLFEFKHKRIEIIRDFQLAKAHVLAKIGK